MALNSEKIKLLFDSDENTAKTLSKCFLSVLKSEKSDKLILDEFATNCK